MAAPLKASLLRIRRGALRFLQFSYVVGRQLRRIERDRQLVDLAGELERHLIILVVDRVASVGPDIEGLVDRKYERDRALHCLRRDHLAVHLEGAGAAASEAAQIVEGQRREAETVIFEIIL